MFDAQKLLGQVLREATNGGLGGGKRRKRGSRSLTGLPSGLQAKVGVGLLGLAIAAYEHFKQAPAASVQTGANPPPAPMPLAGGVPAAAPPTMPPPPPPGRPDLAAPPPAGQADQLRCLHLLRAMVTAANADGHVDPAERALLMQHAREAGFAGEDLDALDREIRNPLSLEQLIVQTPSGLNEDVYVAALIAIDADNPNEHQFLAALSAGLKLDAQALARIRRQLDIAPPSP